MATKRSSSDGGKPSSKRQRTEENGVENDCDMSDEESVNHVNNCSQNPGFRIQEPTVSCIFFCGSALRSACVCFVRRLTVLSGR